MCHRESDSKQTKLMKVLQVNATFGDGSTGNIVKDIQDTCLKNGIECRTAYAFTSYSINSFQGYKIGSTIENKIHALLSRINGKSGYFSYFSTKHLIRIIDEYKPDVINLHNLHSNYVNLPMLLGALAERDIATVVTLHDCWFFTGGCTHYTAAGCRKWMHDCKGCPKKKQDTPAYFKDKAYAILADRYKYFGQIPRLYLVGVSKWITSEASKTIFNKRNCRTIHNGIDSGIFKPVKSDFRLKLGLENKYVILGPASKWLSKDNSQLLDKTVSALHDDEVLLLFGCNNDQLKLNLPHVILHGFTSNKCELAQLYSAADVFANCSHEDTLPTVNLEAQSCGTPVVVYDNTGMKETIKPGCGISVRTDDIQSFISAIADMKGRKKTSKDELHQWIQNNFDKSRNYFEYINLFQSIANGI